MATPQPKIPTPQAITSLVNKQVTQTLDLVNAQVSEVATTLGLPSPPPMPKLTLPTLPGAPGGQQLPLFPFLTPLRPTTRAVGAPPPTEKKEVSTEGKILA